MSHDESGSAELSAGRQADERSEGNPAPSPELPRPAAELPRPAAELPRTGDEQVDEALEQLADVHELAPGDQVEVYVGVHRALQDRLADLEG